MPDSRRIAGAALLLLPAGLMGYLAFSAGGFYPGASAYVAIVLCLVLVVRMLGAAQPFEGVGWGLAVAGGALGLYALWTLLSEHWSHAPGDAVVEYTRTLVYLLATVVFGSVARTRVRMVWVLRTLALAISVVCLCGLITRVLPHLWPTSANIVNERLSYPVSYWNVLGLLAAFGILLCVHLTSDERERRSVQVAAAAAVPVLAATLYFTFSRGSIGVCFIGLVAYILIGRPRGLLSGVVALVPTAAVAVRVAYGATELATPNPTTPTASARDIGSPWPCWPAPWPPRLCGPSSARRSTSGCSGSGSRSNTESAWFARAGDRSPSSPLIASSPRVGRWPTSTTGS